MIILFSRALKNILQFTENCIRLLESKYKEHTMTVKFIGGLWRRIDGSSIKSFATYQEAIDNKASTAWEDNEPQSTTDDIRDQIKN